MKYDEEIIIIDNKKWVVRTYENGTVVKFQYQEYEPEPIPEPEPTEQEIMQAEMLLNQMEIISTQQEQDEVLAEILLNQMEV